MKRFALATLIVLATLGSLLLIWQFRRAMILFGLSLVLAALVRPATDFWVRLGLPRFLGIMLVYLLALGLVVGLAFLIYSPLLDEMQRLVAAIIDVYQRIRETWPEGSAFQQRIAQELPPAEQIFEALGIPPTVALFQNVLGIAQDLVTILGELSIIIVLSIYWSAQRERLEALLFSLFSPEKRTRLQDLWTALEFNLGAYLRYELLQTFFAATFLGLGYWLMGLNYPLLLSITGALLWLIPWLGTVLAVILPFLVGLTISPIVAGIAGVYTLSLLILMEMLIEPRIFNRRRYSSLLVVIVVVVMAETLGLVGLVIAPPIAASIQTLYRHLVYPPAEEKAGEEEGMDALWSRLRILRKEFSMLESRPHAKIMQLVGRLEELMDHADKILG